MVANIWSGWRWGSPWGFTELDGTLYFVANNGVHGSELWVYDPATDLMQLVDIASGSEGSDPSNFYAFDRKLYFSANDGINGRELWVYNTTCSQ